jgi:hypothetical protein
MATSTINQTLIAGAAEGFGDLILPITAFSYVPSVKALALGDTVKIPFAQNTSGSTAFSYTTGYTVEGNLITGKSVVLDKLLYEMVKYTDSDLAILPQEVLLRMGRQMGQKLASDFISSSIASVATQANYPNSGSVGNTFLTANFTASLGFANLDKAANDLSWPDGERTIIANSTLWANFMQNNSIVNAANFGSTSPVQDGVLKKALGFTPYKVSFGIPNTSNGIAVNPNAIGIGNAYHQVPTEALNTIIDAQEIVHELSGLKFGFYSYYDASKRTSVRVFDVLGGAGVLNANALLWIK